MRCEVCEQDAAITYNTTFRSICNSCVVTQYPNSYWSQWELTDTTSRYTKEQILARFVRPC